MSHDHGHPPLRSGEQPPAPPLAPTAWMAEEGEAPGMWDKPDNVKRLLWVLYALCAVLAGADFFYHRHTEHPWEGLYTFYALWAFFGIVFLVIAAKGLRWLTMRSEDYYDAD